MPLCFAYGHGSDAATSFCPHLKFNNLNEKTWTLISHSSDFYFENEHLLAIDIIDSTSPICFRSQPNIFQSHCFFVKVEVGHALQLSYLYFVP